MSSPSKKTRRKTESLFVGIDPGKKGSVAVLHGDHILRFFDLGSYYTDSGASKTSLDPTLFFDGVVSWFFDRPENVLFVGCEQPIFMGPRYTIQTTMSMFESFGVIRTLFSDVFFGVHDKSVVFRAITPKEWIRSYPSLYHPKRKREKEESLAEAQRLFPDSVDQFVRPITRGSRRGGTIMLDGRAEAALIALFVKKSTANRA